MSCCAFLEKQARLGFLTTRRSKRWTKEEGANREDSIRKAPRSYLSSQIPRPTQHPPPQCNQPFPPQGPHRARSSTATRTTRKPGHTGRRIASPLPSACLVQQQHLSLSPSLSKRHDAADSHVPSQYTPRETISLSVCAQAPTLPRLFPIPQIRRWLGRRKVISPSHAQQEEAPRPPPPPTEATWR